MAHSLGYGAAFLWLTPVISDVFITLRPFCSNVIFGMQPPNKTSEPTTASRFEKRIVIGNSPLVVNDLTSREYTGTGQDRQA